MVLQKAVVPDLYILPRQKMKLEPPQELGDGEGHCFLFAAISVILVFKSYAVFRYCDNAVPGNGYLVGISAQVFHYIGHAAKRAFRIHVPVFIPGFFYLLSRIYAICLQQALC